MAPWTCFGLPVRWVMIFNLSFSFNSCCRFTSSAAFRRSNCYCSLESVFVFGTNPKQWNQMIEMFIFHIFVYINLLEVASYVLASWNPSSLSISSVPPNVDGFRASYAPVPQTWLLLHQTIVRFFDLTRKNCLISLTILFD